MVDLMLCILQHNLKQICNVLICLKKNHTNGKTYLKHLNYKDFRIIFNNKLSPKSVYQTLQQDLLTRLPKCTSQLFCSFLSLPFLLHSFFLMVGKSVKFRSSRVDMAQTIPFYLYPEHHSRGPNMHHLLSARSAHMTSSVSQDFTPA